MTLVEDTQQLRTHPLQQPLERRPLKPFHHRQQLQQPLIAIVIPLQHRQQTQRPPQQQLRASVTPINPRVANDALLRRHGIMDCSAK